MFSIAQIRSLQGAMTALGTAAASERTALYQTLTGVLQDVGVEAKNSRLLPVLTASGPSVQGLLFRHPKDAIFRARLVLPAVREAPSAFSLQLKKGEQRPALLGLHYVHGTRRHATAAHYLLAGGLDTFRDANFEFSRLKRKPAVVERFAAQLYAFNTPVAQLEYPKGRKLAILDILKKMDILFMGDLARQDPEVLKARLGSTHWITVRSFLRKLDDLPIPEWRRPAA